MVLKIAADNLDKAKKALEPLAAYAAAINSVPMNCRIRNCQVGGEDWNKESYKLNINKLKNERRI